jgi:hypothetical protein
MASWPGLTVNDAIIAAREILKDPDGERYSDESLTRQIGEGVATMFRIRSDFLVGRRDPRPIYAPGSLAERLPDVVSEYYFQPLIEWVVARVELRDDQFSQDGRAAALFSKMRAALLTPGV